MIKKGTTFRVFIHQIHHDNKYWREPEKFIPERFDPDSAYFLMPNG